MPRSMTAKWDTHCADAIEDTLRAYQCTLGDLVDLANSLPPDDLVDCADSLAQGINGHGERRRYRREMALLGALMHRIIFEVYRIPKSRDAEL